MTLTPRRKRLVLFGSVLLGVAAAAGIATLAFQDNLQYFYNPSEVAAGKVPAGKRFRVGGMVPDGSVQRQPGSLTVRFAVTDYAHTVNITYSGVLPDLFREGQGIIAHGRLDESGVFVADEVLAKHDENYMPPEVKESLKKTHEAAKPPGART
ncbi:MAG: cytochrome c maturation protein CcmE [Gammaproteobacteria bacterium]